MTTQKPSTFLDRSSILAAEDTHYELVEVPEWGGTVRVRSLTGAERDRYDAESWKHGEGKEKNPLIDFRVRRIAKALVDDAGNRLFSDSDVAALGEKSSAAIDRIDDAVARLSGMGESAVRGAIADLKVVPSDASGSG